MEEARQYQQRRGCRAQEPNDGQAAGGREAEGRQCSGLRPGGEARVGTASGPGRQDVAAHGAAQAGGAAPVPGVAQQRRGPLERVALHGGRLHLGDVLLGRAAPAPAPAPPRAHGERGAQPVAHAVPGVVLPQDAGPDAAVRGECAARDGGGGGCCGRGTGPAHRIALQLTTPQI